MRHTRPSLLIALIAFGAITASSSYAHHSSAMFDDKKTVTVIGVVTKFDWSNPHVYIYILQSDGGKGITWEVECSPPSILGRLGWTRATFHPGDAITVVGKPPRQTDKFSVLPNTIKRGEVLLFDRNTELAQLESPGPKPIAAATSHDLEGVWVTLLALKVENKLDTDKMALTAKGKSAVKHFDEKTMHPGADCIANPAPFFMVTPDLKRITKADGVILIDGEFDGAQRTIHMDSSVPPDARSLQGYSIGRWDGKSLLIETTRFADDVMGNAYGLPSGVNKHLFERLTPDASGSSLTYHFELTDTEYLSGAISGDVRWVLRPNLAYAPLQCDPENAKRFAQH